MENKENLDMDLQDVSAILREQAAFCHDVARSVKATFFKETDRRAQDETLRLMLKITAATAVTASAIGRLKATQIRQSGAATRPQKSENADFAKTNSGGAA